MTSPKDMREWEHNRNDAPEKLKQPWTVALCVVIALAGAYFMAQGFLQVKEGFASSNGHATWEQPAQPWQQQPNWQTPPSNGYGPQQQPAQQYVPSNQYPSQYGPPQNVAPTYESNDGW
ncbi:MAG: hypothetical protein NXH85_15520 [Pseudomonadaceae bacterium]|nr:hypothetical protein [Pseudomonadaceae bacterium]